MKRPIVFAAALAALFCFAGCSAGGSGNDEHTHTFASTWTYDESKHWHAATCGHDVRSEEAVHTAGEDGRCTVCSYKAVGMAVAEFAEKYAEKGRDYARSAAKTFAENFDESAVLSEFVWFKTNEKDLLTGVTYLYTASRGEGETPSHMIYRVENNGFSPVDLEEVAGGKSAQMGTSSSSGNLIPYDKDAQAEDADLAAKIVETYCTATGETVDYGTPLLRLFHAQMRASGGIDLRVFDVFESGYTYYIVNVAGDESELSDKEALAAKLGGATAESCKKNGKTDLGTLVYKNIKG